MKKFKKTCTIVFSLLFFLNVTVYGDSTGTIYCIGVNHDQYGGGSTNLEGNFTNNVLSAYDVFLDNVADIPVYYNTGPSQSYLSSNTTGTNIPRIASQVVFLNGHGSPSTINFSTDNSSCIVSINNTGTVRLSQINMTTSELISFVGCQTAKGTTNLAQTAVNRGATSAVGFTDNIHSRNTGGPEWVEAYNVQIAAGQTISHAIATATSASPVSDLGQLIRVYGRSNYAPISASARSISNLNNAFLCETNINANVNISHLPSIIHAELSTFSENTTISPIITHIKEMDPAFMTEDYKISINHYTENPNDAIVIFQYFIDDVIETDKGFVALITNNVLESLIATSAETKILNGTLPAPARNLSTSLNNLVAKQELALSAAPPIHKQASIPLSRIVDEQEGYTYSYLTGKLTYYHSVFFSNASSEEIVDYVVETTLN